MRGLKLIVVVLFFTGVFALGVLVSYQFTPKQISLLAEDFSSTDLNKDFVYSKKLYALMGQEQLVEKSYASRKEQSVSDSISAILVNHHLLASDLVASMFSAVENQNIEKVILLSPDHFGRSHTLASTSNAYWETPYGEVFPHGDLQPLIDLEVVSVNNQAIQQEHGVFNILPFIKRSLPDATIVPLIIHDLATLEEIKPFAQDLSALIDDTTLIVASFDFSHDAMHLTSRFHDEQSISVLQTGDAQRAYRSDIDSRSGLALFIELMNQQGHSFHLVKRSDSSLYTNNPAQTDVTSYITGYYSERPNNASSSVQILASGDVMMDRYIRTLIDRHGRDFPFAHIGRFFYGNDLNVINLEGTITDHPSEAGEEEHLVFTFDPVSAKILAKESVNLVSLANNHSRDFGLEGLEQTTTFLEEQDIQFFGDYFNKHQVSTIQQVGDKNVAFIGFHQYTSDASLILKEIEQQVQEQDYVVVFAHWGVEYHPGFTPLQQKLAHAFIDAGADVILGAGPHIVEPLEIYNQKPVFYSLGNFLFDQKETQAMRERLSVGMSFSEDALNFYLFPLEINDAFQPNLMSYEKSVAWYKDFAQKSIGINEELKNQLESGLLTID